MKVAEGFTKRYAQFLAYYELNPNKLADKLNDKAKVKYHRYLTGETEPGFSTMHLIASAYPISLDWLILGIGEMERTEAVQATILPNDQPPAIVDLEKRDFQEKIAVLSKENQMLKAENSKLWRLTLPESVQKELDFLRSSSLNHRLNTQVDGLIRYEELPQREGKPLAISSIMRQVLDILSSRVPLQLEY